MLKHIVCMKFKEPGAKREAEIVRSMPLNLNGKIGPLINMEVGLDISGSERSYDLVLTATFADMDAFRAYDKHPLHEEVRQYVRGVREAAAAVDYEC